MLRFRIILTLVFILVVFAYESLAQCNGGNPSTDYVSYNHSISVEANFNNARRWEESNRGLPSNCLGDLTAPAGGWNSHTDVERAFYIVQQERIARGKLPYQGMESNLNAIAHAHSQWLFQNDRFDHTGNPSLGTSCGGSATQCQSSFTGSCFWQRITSDPDVDNCYSNIGENIGVAVNQDVVVVTIYGMMYKDLACCAWGHRNNFLKTYTNDYGDAGSEGFLGIGIYSGNGYNWPYASGCPSYSAAIITFETYDPNNSSGCNFNVINLGGSSCMPELTLSGNISSDSYEAEAITSTGSIGSTTSVDLHASTEVVLNSSFSVAMGGTFEVAMDGCTTSLRSESSKVQSKYKGNETLVRMLPPMSLSIEE